MVVLLYTVYALPPKPAVETDNLLCLICNHNIDNTIMLQCSAAICQQYVMLKALLLMEVHNSL